MITEALQALPAEPGVYRFRDARGRALYVGRAGQLRSRVRSYWSDLGDRRHLRRMVPAVTRIEAVVCASPHEAAWLERNLLERSMPPWNRTPGGQETPTAVVVHSHGARAGVSAVPLPLGPDPVGQAFGPYLGGLRVRRAVAGLHRLHPLAYAGPSAGGTARALAEGRGADGQQQEELAAAVTAVLRREPSAVAGARRALEALRHRAAAAEAFEVAGRIQEELLGLAWVTSPQRVSSLQPYDATLVGWSDGVLVEFAVRAGRLDHWSSRPGDEPDPARGAEGTPAGWNEFTRRNAELAALLRSVQADGG